MEWAIAAAVVVTVIVAVFAWARTRALKKPAPTVPERQATPSIPDLSDVDAEDITVMDRLPSLGRSTEEDDREPDDLPPEELPESTDESSEHTGPLPLILVTAVARTDVGRARGHNEDNYLDLPEHSVFAVADGMGGYAGGEVASRVAVEIIEKAFTKGEFPGTRRYTRFRRANELVRAIELANEGVLAQALEKDHLKDMGTTVVAVRFSESRQRVYVANVGDSRCYRLRDGNLSQITRDHTLAVEGGIPGPLGQQLSRAVGIRRRVRVDVDIDEARPGDYYLLCSDGLNKMLNDEQIKNRILLQAHDIEGAAASLVASANERGGRDNITVVLVRVDAADRASLLRTDRP